MKTKTNEGILPSLLERLHQAKMRQKAAAAEVGDLTDEYIAELTERGLKSFKANGVTGTIVQGTMTQVNDALLFEELPATVLDQITTRVIDKGKLEAAAQLGIVSEELLLRAVTLKDKAPYVTIRVNERER